MTEAKRDANARNALASTGPRSPEGKAKSAKNATRHGILSGEVLLPDDSKAAFEAFGAGLGVQLGPVGELEALLVERIVTSGWRLRRVLRVEVELFERTRFTGYPERTRDEGIGFSWLFSHNADKFGTLSRYEAAIERSLFRALHELQRLQAARNGELVPLPAVIDVEASERDGGA